MSHPVRKYRLRNSGGRGIEHDFFFKLGFTKPTKKSKATTEIEDLRKVVSGKPKIDARKRNSKSLCEVE